MPELKFCSHDARCKGPRLIDNHATLCPDSKTEDCDNDHCWVPCEFCIGDIDIN